MYGHSLWREFILKLHELNDMTIGNNMSLPHQAEPKSWRRKMLPRNPTEIHRVATPLELLFDLVFVIAISVAGVQLHHGLAEHHFSQIVPLYQMVFFAIWWAWVNFSWFASAYDNDDVPYRMMVFVQIVGSLVIAAGIPAIFKSQDFSVVIIGYVIMRLMLVVQWIRAGLSDPSHRDTAFRYAFGIVLVQIVWVIYQWQAAWLGQWGFVLCACLEMLVPMWAEKCNQTPWHPHHISERYSLLTLIVLGETILASFTAVQTAIDNSQLSANLISLMVGGMIMMFAIWWSYFDRPAHHILTSFSRAFAWGYGHYFVFMSIAALGAGLAVGVDTITAHAHLSQALAGYVIAIPLSIYSVAIWLVHDIHVEQGWRKILHPLSILPILLFPMFFSVGCATLVMGVYYAVCQAIRPVLIGHHTQQVH